MRRRRHESLQPLTRHHHYALVVAMHLVRREQPASALAAELRHFWENGGQAHFREEEEILLPAYAKYGSLERPEIVQMLVEHVKIRSLVSRALEDGDESVFEELGALLRAHVQLEEQTVFPLIEDTLQEPDLARLAPFFEEHRASSPYAGGAEQQNPS
ncbi:hemerythrin domain-containing protein [Alicyclobacillus vulcanalis]|uniref:Hemerythrin HHE cation binding domain-containing protein n=1 Tax=Alicyclobacillus vulcanalis TaxID=252246 RepID=A0A1N7K0I7_9BACL|nr:hemerythrin domain-containing protein [Alicyclobacillus vulcanalis]SIS54954.1 Hemerythrin HHE cation binding domain-containing protein [Alicyclobacillus vulcanalis]